MPREVDRAIAAGRSTALAELAEELVDPLLDLDPACAVACSRLLTDPDRSPLVNASLPAEDVGSRLVRIRSGFHPTQPRSGGAERPDDCAEPDEDHGHRKKSDHDSDPAPPAGQSTDGDQTGQAEHGQQRA